MEVNQAIAQRRSIRKFKPDAIPDETLQEVLEAVRLAPSWANTQCWRLVVIIDPVIKEKLAGTTFGARTPVNRAGDGLRAAPVAVAFCAAEGASGFSFNEPKKPATDKGDFWYMFDTALAMENFCLAAAASGLGTVIIGAFDAAAAAEILQVPAGYTVVALTPLGYPDEAPEARPRKAMSEIVFYNRFGAQ
jgi:nitroreductase